MTGVEKTLPAQSAPLYAGQSSAASSDDPRALAFARKAMAGGAAIGVFSCCYGLFFAGPAGNLSPWEWVTVPLTGIFSAIMAIIVILNNKRYISRAGIAYAIWVSFHASTNVAYELFNQPDFGNIMIYMAWLPAAYLFSTAVADLKTSIRLSCATIGVIVFALVAFVLTSPPLPPPGVSHVWDALVVSILVQPAILAIIYGVAQYREHYISEHAKLEQMAENSVLLEKVAEEARQGRQAAEHANEVKNQFLANVSHELRTPLNGILGLTEILRLEKSGDASAKMEDGYLDAIKDSGDALLVLIENILALSHVETGVGSLEDKDVDLQKCFVECADLFRGLPEAEGHSLDIQIVASLPLLSADEILLQKMCLSLLSNAGKFSTGPGAIRLAAGLEESGGLTISVADQGTGIPAEKLSQIGDPFFQVDGSSTRENPGLGLGLALTSARMEMHGGHLHIDSTPAGGTTVKLMFPAFRVISDRFSEKTASAISS